VTEAKEVVERYHRAVAARDLEAMRAVLAADVAYTTQGQTVRGAEPLVGSLQATLRAFPDVTYEFKNVIGEGDTVAVEGVFRGTHTGPLTTNMGQVAPTGKRVEFVFASFMKVVDGKIASIVSYHDPMDFIGDMATPFQMPQGQMPSAIPGQLPGFEPPDRGQPGGGFQL
jgi:predicted ester cyclase